MEDADLDKAADLAVAGRHQELRPALHRGEAHPGGRQASPTPSSSGSLAKAQEAEGRRSDGSRDRCRHGDQRARRDAVRAARQRRGGKHGAKLLHGNDRQGALFPPTVVDHVAPDCELVREETFGPVDPDHPRARTTSPRSSASRTRTAYGLSSGVCTNRLDYITRFVAELEVGTVNIWEVPGLPHRDVAVRRHQGFRPRLQGRRARGDEELHQRQDLVAALLGRGSTDIFTPFPLASRGGRRQ